jgi:hypothetical protein
VQVLHALVEVDELAAAARDDRTQFRVSQSTWTSPYPNIGVLMMDDSLTCARVPSEYACQSSIKLFQVAAVQVSTVARNRKFERKHASPAYP